MTLNFSRRLAFLFGLLLPVAELTRRWHQLGSWAVIPYLVDDFLVGASPLFAAWRCRKDLVVGSPFLAAACGMAYNSLAWQLMALDQPDPAPIPSLAVAAVKGAGLLLAVFALIGALRERTAY
jgi:hypothetical protein